MRVGKEPKLWFDIGQPLWTDAEKVEEKYGATFMGYWAIFSKIDESWTETPWDVYYQPNPDKTKGHTNYFAIGYRGMSQKSPLLITEGSGAFRDTLTGIVAPDGEVLVSRHRHDYRAKGAVFIDGGRDYLRSSGGRFVNLLVTDDRFIIKEGGECD